MPSQLRCKDLQSGDIMVKVNDGSLVARLITAGQTLFKEKTPDITHAGVMFDSNFIIEAQGSGIMVRHDGDPDTASRSAKARGQGLREHHDRQPCR